jgi:pyruvate dehydrogenase E2 component (dihydrolipoamide acetyltransferase)
VRGLSNVKDIDHLRGLLKMLGPKAAESPDTVVNAMLQELSRGRLYALVDQLLDGSSSCLDILPALTDIKDRVPVSAVIGIQDQIIPKEHLFILPPHVRIHILNAGHVPQWDAPAEIAALLQNRSANI